MYDLEAVTTSYFSLDMEEEFYAWVKEMGDLVVVEKDPFGIMRLVMRDGYPPSGPEPEEFRRELMEYVRFELPVGFFTLFFRNFSDPSIPFDIDCHVDTYVRHKDNSIEKLQSKSGTQVFYDFFRYYLNEENV